MTQEEKQLLLKDLCMRIPYRTLICLNPGAYNKPETCLLCGVDGERVYLNVDSDPFRIDHIKPYLRPMSSMTDEENEELKYEIELELQALEGEEGHNTVSAAPATFEIDFYNKHHIDYRGLIPMGLALEAPEGMYKTE